MNESEQNIIAKYSLIDVVQDAGVNLVREGTVWVGDCPFHDDNNAALLVEPSTQHWQCDGVCQAGGTLIEWLMKAHAIRRDEAIVWIKTGQGINCMPITKQNCDALLSSNQEGVALDQQVVDYYHQTLKGNSSALAYLKHRKLDHAEMLDYFKLGFSDRSLGSHLPKKNRKEGAAIRGKLQRIGWLKGTGHELMRGSLVIPVMNDQQILQVYGRKVTSNLRSGTLDHVYLHTEYRGVFNLEVLKASDEWILCQSLIDALTFWCAGFRNVTTSYDLHKLPEELIHAISVYQPKRLLIAFEATERGEKVVLSVNKQLDALNVERYQIELPKGMDVNEVAVKHDKHQQVLGDLIRKAAWLGKGIQPEITNNIDDVVIEQEAVNPELDDEPGDEGDEAVQPNDEESLEYEEPLVATVSPASPERIDQSSNEIELTFNFEQRRYRVRGLDNNKSFDQLRINLLVSLNGALHVDSFDLYSTKHRQAFIKLASIELNFEEQVIRKDLSQLLLQLEIEQQKKVEQKDQLTTKLLSDKDQQHALEFLKSPLLIEHIIEDLTQCGLVGEESNKLLAYLITLSRKLEKPLAAIVQSTSAAGKSALMKHVLDFVPPEDRIQYSALTGQSLFYMSDLNLKHKILAISENEGVSQAAYALRVLQSEGELSIATTGKDPLTGRHTTYEYKVEGPVSIFSTTTAVDIDEELLNRCLVIQVNEDTEQTQAIHDRQRFEQTLEGLKLTSHKQTIINRQQNAQRLLKPLLVVNPYAAHLTFGYSQARTRRDHPKYLTLINTIALLHQYQREVKTTYLGDKQVSYIEVKKEDIAIANSLIKELLGQALTDLPSQTRKLLALLDEMVSHLCETKQMKRGKIRFTRRDIQEYTHLGMTQITVHLRRLEAQEYLIRHRGSQGLLMVYELCYYGEQKQNEATAGLVDIEHLQPIVTTENNKGNGGLPVTSRNKPFLENLVVAKGNTSVLSFTGFSNPYEGSSHQHHDHTSTRDGDVR